MKFTIITVVYNDKIGLKKTIESVYAQSCQDYEYIIKDGGSTDGTMELANELKNSHTQVVSCPDKGIYDAMNQAISMSTGDYLYFLNAGDTFHDNTVLEKVNSLSDNITSKSGLSADIIYGNIQRTGSENFIKKYGKICQSPFFFLTGDCICHQTMFARKHTFNRLDLGIVGFDLRYKVCSDKDWQLYNIKNHATFATIDMIVADMPWDGFSTGNVDIWENESSAILKYHCPNIFWIHKLIFKLKKNPILLGIFRSVENIVFKKK